MNYLVEKILSWFNIEFNSHKLAPLPNSVILTTVMLSISALLNFWLDIGLELLSVAGIITKLPFRFDFIAIAAISALIAYQTLQSIRRRELELTQDAVSLAFVVETVLVVSDSAFVFFNPVYVWFRILFIVLSACNLCCVIYIAIRLRLFMKNY